MSQLPNILIVDDDVSLANQFKWLLKKEHHVTTAATSEEAQAVLASREFNVLLLDLGLPPHPEDPTVGLALLCDVVDKYPLLKVIVLTAHGDQLIARKALSCGAYDFLVKPVNEHLLGTLIKRAFYRQKLEAEFWEERKDDVPVPMVVKSPNMAAIVESAREVAGLPVSCIIFGETGTGKELIAQLIHRFSPRNNQPLVVVECSSIPITLGESELFGAEKGSYTGSTTRRDGRIKQAEKGTLFLDEVGELTLELQAKLLRFLETHEYTPIGGKTCHADVRIVAATNRNLVEEVERGRFRLDLYHRLCQMEITIPPLRERNEEIVPMAVHFLGKLAHEFRMSPPSLTGEAEAALRDYPFPGNVRELKNIMSRAMIVSKGNPITVMALGLVPGAESQDDAPCLDIPSGFDLVKARSQLEYLWIEEALKRHKGKVTPAAVDLGVPRPTLYDLMKKHGVQGSGFRD